MAKIRRVNIERFRTIESLLWYPNGGVNCLIGAGDSGKTAVLTAIDYCLGARRTLSLSDADFFQMDGEAGLRVEVTLGALSDSLQTFDKYGLFLQGYDADSREIVSEPEDGKETVLTVRLDVGDSLEPKWTLASERAAQQGVERNLSWGDRVQLAPIRIGGFAAHHMSWQHASILNRLSDEKPTSASELANAARQARLAFGETAGRQLKSTLGIVLEEALELGVPVGDEVKALLDAHSVSFSDGMISLHDAHALPLKSLGLGSSRLLVAGLQRRIADRSSITLIDELEYGLEPHRIGRFIVSLGAKDPSQPLQVFMTTHSPTALKELAAEQLYLLRRASAGNHEAVTLSGSSDRQGTVRIAPEAFLGRKVIVCEGATEVGLIRGIDLHRSDEQELTISSLGTVAIDAGGISKIYPRASVFQGLGFETATFRDDDVDPNPTEEFAFNVIGGTVFKWDGGFSTEEALFAYVSDLTVERLVRHAASAHGEGRVRDNLATAKGGPVDLELFLNHIGPDERQICGTAAKSGAWFKSISLMEAAAREVIAPDLDSAQAPLKDLLTQVFDWAGLADA